MPCSVNDLAHLWTGRSQLGVSHKTLSRTNTTMPKPALPPSCLSDRLARKVMEGHLPKAKTQCVETRETAPITDGETILGSSCRQTEPLFL